MKHIKTLRLKLLGCLCGAGMVFIASSFILPPGEEHCITLLRSIYSKMNGSHLNDEVLYLNYTVIAVPYDTVNNETTTNTIEVWMNKQQMHLKSDHMQVYQDNKDIFTILPNKKLVYRSDAFPGPEKAKKAGKLGLLQDTLFTLCHVVQCESNPASPYQKIVLRTNERGKKLFNIRELVFHIDTRKQVLKRIRINYNKKWMLPGLNEGLSYMEYTFNTNVHDAGKKKLDKPVERLVMQPGKKLAAPYTGFQLVDNRYKTNPIRYE